MTAPKTKLSFSEFREEVIKILNGVQPTRDFKDAMLKAFLLDTPPGKAVDDFLKDQERFNNFCTEIQTELNLKDPLPQHFKQEIRGRYEFGYTAKETIKSYFECRESDLSIEIKGFLNQTEL